MPSPDSPSTADTDVKAGSSSQTGDTSSKNHVLDRICDLIKSGKVKNIVVLTGAGISTSAGIPDFRSPETGLYANLERLNLPFPEAVFELNYFKKNPVPFWTLAKDLYPGEYLPTPTHYFLTLLHTHSLLLRTFTQNIDTLETLAGLPPDKIIEAHGSFAEAHCLSCKKSISREYVLEAGVRDGTVVRCDEEGCGGLVKPDIVFFGEGLPDRFFENISDLKKADLVIVIGTSLQVHPFASLPQYCKPGVPRLLINREAVGPFKPARRGTGNSGLRAMLNKLGISGEDSDDGENEDGEGGDGEAEAEGGEDYTFWAGDADEGVQKLVRELKWEEELEELIRAGDERLTKSWAAASAEVAKGESEALERSISPSAEKGVLASGGEDVPGQDEDSSSDEDDDGKVPGDEIKEMGRMLAEHMKRGPPKPAESEE